MPPGWARSPSANTVPRVPHQPALGAAAAPQHGGDPQQTPPPSPPDRGQMLIPGIREGCPARGPARQLGKRVVAPAPGCPTPGGAPVPQPPPRPVARSSPGAGQAGRCPELCSGGRPGAGGGQPRHCHRHPPGSPGPRSSPGGGTILGPGGGGGRTGGGSWPGPRDARGWHTREGARWTEPP